jgi:hypothetical protein
MRHSFTQKAKWTKHGWVATTLTQEEKKSISSVRANMPYQREDMEFEVSHRNDLSAVIDIQQTIQVGNTLLAMDDLPYAIQHMLREEDKWHISNGKLFRVVDPITQAKDGEWGTDKSLADQDLLQEHDSIARQYLQMVGLLDPEASEEECTDILGMLSENDNGELLSASPLMRVDVSLERVGQIAPEVEGHEEDFDGLDIFDRAPSEDNTDVNYDTDDYEVGQHLSVPLLPEISDELMARVVAIRDEWIPRIKAAKNEEEREVASIVMEQFLDRALESELANKMDSPWLGYQYSPPRRKHEFIQIGSESYLTVAAEDRKLLFKKLLSEAGACKSKSDLYGEDQQHGFYGKIREMYSHDRDIAREWSIENTVNKDETVTQSAFNKARQNFVDVWRTNRKGDEEKLRKALYVFFDRIAGEYPAEYDSRGTLVKSSYKEKDSRWRQERTEAMKDLFLTKSQWNSIYAMLNLVKKRLELNTHPTADAKATAELLQEQFSKINNLSDLTTYRVWATKRNWKKAYSEVISHRPDGKKYVRTVSRVTDEFVPSMIDRISIVNEIRWFAALRRKENFLKGRIKLFAHLETVIKEVIPMDFPEISVTCPHRTLVKDEVAKRFVEKNCDCMAIGVPQFAVLQDGKGICFVQCEECGHKVWLLNQEESGSDIHTMEECHERINQSI